MITEGRCDRCKEWVPLSALFYCFGCQEYVCMSHGMYLPDRSGHDLTALCGGCFQRGTDEGIKISSPQDALG